MNVKGNTQNVAIDFCRKDKTNIPIDLIALNCFKRRVCPLMDGSNQF